MDMTKWCFLVVALMGFLTSCDKVFDISPDSPQPDPLAAAYPIDRLITDKKGRTIDAKITGKSPDSITFFRKSDGKRFEYPISDLSVKDKAFVEGLPRNRKEKMARPSPPYIAHREKELQSLHEQIARLTAKAEGSSSEIEQRSLKRDIDLLRPRIVKLNEQIETYRRQNPDQ